MLMTAPTRAIPITPAETTSDWPLFRGDAARTAATATPGPTGNLTPLWVFTSDARNPSNPIVAGDSVYVLGDDGILWALDRATGAQRWAVVLGGEYTDGYHSAPAFDGGMLYTGTATGMLLALDPATGAEHWRFATEDVIISPPLAANGVLYAGSNDGFVYAVDGKTGKLRWRADTGPIFAAATALAGDALYVGAADGTLFSLDAASGAERWKFTTGRRIKTSAVAAGIVYAPSGDGRLYALDAATGKQRWVSRDIGHPATVNNPAVLGNTVVVTIDNVGAFAYDAQSGAGLWERTDYAEGGISSAVIAGPVVYVSVHDKDFDTLDLKTGQTIATYELGRFAGAPAFAGGILHIFADDGKGYAFGAVSDFVAPPVPPPPVVGTMPNSAPLSQPPVSRLPSIGTLVRTISTGNGPSDPLRGPEGIAFNQDGSMYLVDALNDRIVVYDKSGALAKVIGRRGTGNGEFAFSNPDTGGFFGDLTFGPDGSLYVCDPFNAQVQRLAADGSHIATASVGEGALPSSIAIDPAVNRLFLSDLASGQVLVFSLDLEPNGAIGSGGNPTLFDTPFELATVDDGSLWVAEYDGNTFTHIGKDGTTQERIGRYGIADGRFAHMVGIAVDSTGYLYASDYGNGRVQVFHPDGTVIGMIGSKGEGDSQFRNPTYLAIGPDGLLFVSDEIANRVQVFSVELPS
jgi:outer membrane protein assembly factor BamB/sugar lactone lactonase YvrE